MLAIYIIIFTASVFGIGYAAGANIGANQILRREKQLEEWLLEERFK